MYQAEQFGDKFRETKLRCFRHVQRRDSGHTGQRKLKIELSDRRKTERAQMRYSEGGHSEG